MIVFFSPQARSMSGDHGRFPSNLGRVVYFAGSVQQDWFGVQRLLKEFGRNPSWVRVSASSGEIARAHETGRLFAITVITTDEDPIKRFIDLPGDQTFYRSTWQSQHFWTDRCRKWLEQLDRHQSHRHPLERVQRLSTIQLRAPLFGAQNFERGCNILKSVCLEFPEEDCCAQESHSKILTGYA